jgi:uncharacterized protein with FMN-binding domain
MGVLDGSPWNSAGHRGLIEHACHAHSDLPEPADTFDTTTPPHLTDTTTGQQMDIRQKKIALAAMTGLSLSAALAGCATGSAGSAEAETAPSSTATSAAGTSAAPAPSAGSSDSSGSGSSGSDAAAASVYADGTYDATGTYTSPNGQEEIDVSLTLEGDVITAVTVTPEATNPNSVNYQTQFADGIAEVVVGKNIDEIEVSRVAGSSLTSGGFNEAVETIKDEAA